MHIRMYHDTWSSVPRWSSVPVHIQTCPDRSPSCTPSHQGGSGALDWWSWCKNLCWGTSGSCSACLGQNKRRKSSHLCSASQTHGSSGSLDQHHSKKHTHMTAVQCVLHHTYVTPVMGCYRYRADTIAYEYRSGCHRSMEGMVPAPFTLPVCLCCYNQIKVFCTCSDVGKVVWIWCHQIRFSYVYATIGRLKKTGIQQKQCWSTVRMYACTYNV